MTRVKCVSLEGAVVRQRGRLLGEGYGAPPRVAGVVLLELLLGVAVELVVEGEEHVEEVFGVVEDVPDDVVDLEHAPIIQVLEGVLGDVGVGVLASMASAASAEDLAYKASTRLMW